MGHNQLIKAKHSVKTSAGIVDDLAKRRLPPTRIDGDGFEIRSNNPAFSIASFRNRGKHLTHVVGILLQDNGEWATQRYTPGQSFPDMLKLCAR